MLFFILLATATLLAYSGYSSNQRKSKTTKIATCSPTNERSWSSKKRNYEIFIQTGIPTVDTKLINEDRLYGDYVAPRHNLETPVSSHVSKDLASDPWTKKRPSRGVIALKRIYNKNFPFNNQTNFDKTYFEELNRLEIRALGEKFVRDSEKELHNPSKEKFLSESKREYYKIRNIPISVFSKNFYCKSSIRNLTDKRTAIIVERVSTRKQDHLSYKDDTNFNNGFNQLYSIEKNSFLDKNNSPEDMVDRKFK